MDLPAPDFSTLTRPQLVGWGARYALRGARLVITQPFLWSYVLAPVLLMAVTFALGATFLLWVVPVLTGLVWVPGPDASGLVTFVYAMAVTTLRVLLVAGLLLVLYLSAGIVATPFNDRLSDTVERRVLGGAFEDPTFDQHLRDLFWSITHSVLSLSVYLVVMAFLLLLNLLPGLGSAVSFVVGGVVSAGFFTREAMDGSFSRRRMRYVEKWRLVLRHWPLALGFGGVVSLGMWIPLMNFLVLPLSVAGGTLLFCHLERAGLVPGAAGTEVPGVVEDPVAHR